MLPVILSTIVYDIIKEKYNVNFSIAEVAHK